MIDGSWIKCNKCFCDLEVVKYPEGIYINPCSCRDEELFQKGYQEGYSDGYDEGVESVES